MNKELEEAIKRLAEINEKVEEYDGNILKQDIETVLNYIEKSEKELESKNRLLEITRIELNETEKQLEDSIPKEVIKETIEELDKKGEHYIFSEKDNAVRLGKMQVLEGLLEGK